MRQRITSGGLVAAFAICLLQAIVSAGTALAADPARLRDGVSVLESMRRDKNPEINRFIDDVVVDKLPPRAPGSGLTRVDGNTDPGVFSDKNNIFVKNNDGSISYISRDRLRAGLDEVAGEVTGRKDFDKVFQEGIKIVPSDYRGLVEVLNDTVELMEKSGLGMLVSRAELIRKHGVKLIVKEMRKDSDKYRRDAIAAHAAAATPPGGPKPPVRPGQPQHKPPQQPGTTTVTPAVPAKPDCTREEAALAGATADIAAGRLGAAQTALNGIDTTKCPELATAVSNGLQQIADRVAELNRDAQAALSSCDRTAIDDAASALRGVSHPGLTTSPSALSARSDALGAAWQDFERARGSYRSGNLADARSGLTAVRASMARDGVQDCEPYTRAGNGLTTIDRMETVLGQANAVAAECDLDRITRMISRLQKRTHVLLQQALRRLEAAKKKCEEGDTETGPRSAADQRCVDRYGPHSYSAQSSADGINICECRKPYRFDYDRTKCVEPGQVMATANASCRERYGPDAYADAEQSNYKTYVCVCGNGTVFNCEKTRCVNEQALLASLQGQANDICAKRYGKSLRSVKVYPSCKYECVFAKTTTRRRPPSRPSRRPPKPGHDKALSIAVGIGIGIITSTPTRRRPQPSQPSRCHHQRTTSKTHCGSN